MTCAGAIAGAGLAFAVVVSRPLDPVTVEGMEAAPPAPPTSADPLPAPLTDEAVGRETTETTSTAPGFLVADAAVPSVELFAAGGVPLDRSLPNPTKYGLPLVFRVMEDHGRWLDVQLPTRPNGTRAFVRRTDVVLRTVPNWIRVVLSTRRVTVFNGFTPLLETVGAVGRATSVTPTGWFYVDASVLLTDPTGPYGAGQLTLSGFSEVYTSFAGGEGQIALHGTNAAGSIGQAASNGCVRLENGAFLRVQELAPTGTPVQIVP